MRRLFICVLIAAASWYLSRAYDLPTMVGQMLPQAKEYADAILIGVYTLLLLLAAPAIHPKLDASKIKVESKPLKVDLNVMDFDPDQIVRLVGKLNISDPQNVLPAMAAKMRTIKSTFEGLSDLDETYDFDELEKVADNVASTVKSLHRLSGVEMPQLNGELKHLHEAMDEINEITKEHDLEKRAEQAEELADFADALRRLKAS